METGYGVKCGAGKTTVAASLTISLAAEQLSPPLFLDCDVEAPNAHLSLHPRLTEQQHVGLLIPPEVEAIHFLWKMRLQ
jgi:MinD superfamily P-loop ATPase